MQIDSALVRDIVAVITSALQHKRLYDRIGEPSARCDLMNARESIVQYWPEGRELLQNIDVKNLFILLIF